MLWQWRNQIRFRNEKYNVRKTLTGENLESKLNGLIHKLLVGLVIMVNRLALTLIYSSALQPMFSEVWKFASFCFFFWINFQALKALILCRLHIVMLTREVMCPSRSRWRRKGPWKMQAALLSSLYIWNLVYCQCFRWLVESHGLMECQNGFLATIVGIILCMVESKYDSFYSPIPAFWGCK